MASPKFDSLRWKAHNLVTNAIASGKLIRQPCVVCGSPDSEAHHDDYAQPLNVRWLCYKHHQAVHHPKAADGGPLKLPITLSLARRTHELLEMLTDPRRGFNRSKSAVIDTAVARYAESLGQQEAERSGTDG